MAKDKAETPAPRLEGEEEEFDVVVKETVTRTSRYETKVLKENVVNDIPLSPDQEDDWLTYVPTYLPGHWDTLRTAEPEEVLSEEITATEFETITVRPAQEKKGTKTVGSPKGGTATPTGGGAVQGARSSDDLKGKK